jgi:arabinose-5-phosphate isomerase
MPPARAVTAAAAAAEFGEAIDVARRVLRAEIEGLRALEGALDGGFAAAVDRLAAVHGRVIVTGMGKSGHVARKIAATFASTGTPAQFVHPAEASHGDLGMIAPGDAVLALSNSGETAELSAIVDYSRRFSIPLVAMTRRAGSALAEASDAVLLLPPSPEACPLGLAPTTSTTMMLALGDALAVALLERRGFSPSDFHVFHPGGKLGSKLIHVDEIMHVGDDVPLVSQGTAMAEAILAMTAKRLGCVGIAGADGSLVGIITDGDLRRNMSPQLLDAAVDSVMNPRPKTIRPRALAAEALNLMNGQQPQVMCLFVVDEAQRPIGVVHMHDCLRAGVV